MAQETRTRSLHDAACKHILEHSVAAGEQRLETRSTQAVPKVHSARARKELRDMMKNVFTLECSGVSEKERGRCTEVELEGERGVG